MIIDRLMNYRLYTCISEELSKGLEFLAESDLHNIPIGKYEIDGSNLFAIVSEYETSKQESISWEAHKRYIDIQYVVKGKEKIGYSNIDSLKVIKVYDNCNDVVLGKAEGDFLEVVEGTFMILFPQDVHMPGVRVNEVANVKKIVVKVSVE